MKNLSLVLLGMLSISLNSYGIDKVIYGKDDRIELYQFVGSPLAHLGNSVAAMVNRKDLKKSLLGDYMEVSSNVPKLKEAYPFCGKENFENQPLAAMCTGFLVHPKIIVTAGHCYTTFAKDMCKHANWIFDYKVFQGESTNKMVVYKENIYRCKKVHKEITDARTGVDYAIIELERGVFDRGPVKLNLGATPRKGARLVIMGHPMGLPLKVASNARVLSNSDVFFSTNLDSFQGNSGSPVFNLRSGKVEGILVRGKADTYKNNSCYKINYCDEDGRSCEKKSSPEGEEVLSVATFIDELNRVLRKL